MPGKYERTKFKDVDLNDNFFDELKQDYPEFEKWFQKKSKSEEEAFTFRDEEGLCAFIYLKESENEEIKLKDKILPKINRTKIGTLKLKKKYQGKRLGEGAIGITLWRWQELKTEEIYLTVYENHDDIIKLIERYGFVCKGELLKEGNTNGKRELIYMRSRKDIDYTDPYKSFPFIKSNFKYAGILPIFDYYHDRLLPYSELKNTQQEFWDEAAGNGISKIFIGSPKSEEILDKGCPVFLYRKFTGDGQKTYKSCITSYGTITDIKEIKRNKKALMGLEEFIKKCGNKTIFSKRELEKLYEKDNLVVYGFLYNGFFGKGNNVSHHELFNNSLFNTHPYGIKYAQDDFIKILKMGGKNEQDIIIDQS